MVSGILFLKSETRQIEWMMLDRDLVLKLFC